MKKIVPFSVNYETIRKINLVGSLILYLSATLAILVIINEKLHLPSKIDTDKFLNSFLSFFSIAYFLQDLIQNYLFQLAEVHRKNDFIDNSFDTTLSDKNSEGYFSNDDLQTGIYKLGVNCFENSFFTKSVSLSMIPAMAIKTIIIVLLFTLISLFADKMPISVLMQVALPLTIIQQAIRLTTFYFRINSIYNQFKTIFSSINSSHRDSYLIINVVNYESTVAWAGILLDSQIFNRLNDSLTEQWTEIKTRHKIK